MPIKDLLVLVERTAAAGQRLEFALAIAARFSARVTAIALVPHPYTPAMVGVHIPADLVRAQIEQAEREAEIVLEEAKQLAHSPMEPRWRCKSNPRF
jgi:nucleotide-binding universal stress UspA family protein